MSARNSRGYHKLSDELLTLQKRRAHPAGWPHFPLEVHGFSLHKSTFHDALCLRYGWQPQLLPTTCTCGHSFTIDHALCCPTGAFPIVRHDELQDLTADLLSEVCHDVCIEPHLQPLTGESLSYSTTNTEENVRLDIRARGFWGTMATECIF